MESGEGLAPPTAPITTGQARSNAGAMSRGGRYFIYRPPLESDPSGAVANTAGRRAAQVSTTGFPSWRRVPASQVEGSVVNCRRRNSQRHGGRRRCAQFDGRLLDLASGHVFGGRAFHRTYGRGGGGAAGRSVRTGVDVERVAARHDSSDRHGGHRAAARPAACRRCAAIGAW
ncbi:hypothetical protein PAHAL_1G081900 [Panicum hallii]|jgi:hypothetical protein|uniref:Uncharacterized protein n=1 Tax=Panicum hallii TaxID=206008 RepID=A0A2S3GMJ2_9POAL|nr:hypothetical protein PAHAL_1G081900 [Panicum hallii]